MIAGLQNEGLEEDTSTVLSSLPSSSPIRYTSPPSSTPIAVRDTTATRSLTLASEATASQDTQSYEEFWAQLRTPTLSEGDVPSALQTPRNLTPTTNANLPASPWTSNALRNAIDAAPARAGDENHPPLSTPAGHHPPVASRLRKRRRGMSPAFGERAKKSARRKGKARDNVAEPQEDTGIHVLQVNPWAASSPRPHTDPFPQEEAAEPVFLPSSFPNANHTPYDDFGRARSATTSFYGRFNESASCPTPHRLSDSPSSPAAGSLNATPRQASTPPPPHTASRRTSVSNSRHSMEVDGVSERGDTQADLEESLLRRPGGRHDSSASISQRTGDHEQHGHRRLQSLLYDSSYMEDRSSHYRSPTMEDIPEEGEIRSRSSTFSEETSYRQSTDDPFRRDGYGYPSSNASPRHERDYDPLRPLLSRHTNAMPLPRGLSESRSSERGSSRLSGSFHLEEAPVWRSSTHLPSPSPVPRPHPDQGRRQTEHRSCADQGRLTDRVNNLDVFNVGDDDNLPDAVRRGGAAQEGVEELQTPIPHEGDPEVHRHDPEAHLLGLSDNWIQAVWADPSNTSITLNTFNPRFTRSYGANRRTASDLRRFINQITGESTFLVIAPDQAPFHRGRGPVEWAITGLSQDGVERVLHRRVWSFRSITFFPHRRSLETPRWLLALEGFLEDNVGNIEAAVRSTFERPQVRRRIEQLIRANPEFEAIPTDEAFRRIMSTLRVSVYTLDNETVVANVFLRSPTQSIRIWRRWIQELRELSFGSFHTAVARVRRISSCAGCLGVDHPSHLCPFPQLSGWNGPESAGGTSYSIDGRDRPSRQPSETRQSMAEVHAPRRHHSQASYGPDPSQAGPSRPRGARSEGEWGDSSGRGREGGRELERDRYHEQGRRGIPRRGRKDSSGPPKYGRDSFRKDSRR